ncbi:cupin domain-containing protein [Candidatus Daviesbacteria bacterium]|nr:cupin domain-containing protein [Candidatus Daviesbacteria bacterium]
MQIIKFNDLKFIPASHEDFQNPGVWKKVLLKKEDLTAGRVQMINWAKLPKNNSFKPHYHQDMTEVFIILNGQVKMNVDQEGKVLGKGDAVIVPPNKVHQMRNLTNEDVEYICIGITTEQNGKTIVIR